MTSQTKSRTTMRKMPLSKIRGAGYNPRTISPEALSGLGKSLERFGVVQPLVWNKRTKRLVAGHQRLAALKASGAKNAPVVEVDLTEIEEKALNVALNSPEIAGIWTPEVGAILDEIKNEAAELFAHLRLDALSDSLSALIDSKPNEGLTDPDDIPEARKNPGVKRGDLFALGDHRMLCGDSTDRKAQNIVLGDESPRCVWTDPPYGVAYKGKTKQALEIENDNLDEPALARLLRESIGLAFSNLAGGGAIYVAAPAGPLHIVFARVLGDLRAHRQTIIWVKDQFVLGRSDFHYRHEPIFYGVKPGKRQRPPRDEDSVWEIPRPRANREHPTMKPVELVARAIRFSTRSGDSILDPFSGSGTTILAAERLGRKAIGIEIDPSYCRVAIDRWEAFTGKKAEKIS